MIVPRVTTRDFSKAVIFMKFGVQDILWRIFIAYSSANHLNVNFIIILKLSGFGKKALIFLLSISRNYVVSVRRGFFLLLVLGQAALFHFGPALALTTQIKVQILGTC